MKIIVLDEFTVLQQVQLTDVPEIFHTIDSQREYMGRWLTFVEHTECEDDTRAVVELMVSVPPENMAYTFVIRQHGEFAGLIGLKDTDRMNIRTEIGYWLSEPFQGRGIMTSAVRALCGFVFDELSLNRVQIKCAVGNMPSNRIPQRLGFVLEGIEREGECAGDGTFRDLNVYSMLADEWNAGKNK